MNSFNDISLYGTTIHGIKIFGLRSTTGLYEVYEGGLGYDSVVFRFYSASPGQGFSFFIEIYQNSEEETTFDPITEPTSTLYPTSITDPTSSVTISTSSVPTSTIIPTTTELPEKRVKEWGVINDDSVLLAE